MGFAGVFIHQMLQVRADDDQRIEHGLADRRDADLVGDPLRDPSSRALRRLKITSLVLGFAGALLVVTRGDFSPRVFGRPSTLDDLLILTSTVNWAVYPVIGHKTVRRPAAPRRARCSSARPRGRLGSRVSTEKQF